MKATVQLSRGVETLFGTRDENILLIEAGLNVKTRLGEDTLEIEGEPDAVCARPRESFRITFALSCVKAPYLKTVI